MRSEDRIEVRSDAIPAAVRVIGWISIALGVLIALAASFIVPGGLLVLLFLQAAFHILVGAGLVTGRFWAYYVAVVMAAINAITLLVAAFSGTTALLVPLSINVTILYWLLRRDVRGWAGLASQ